MHDVISLNDAAEYDGSKYSKCAFLYFSTEIYDFTNIEWMPELQLNLENIHLTNLQPGRANIMVSNTVVVKSLYVRINP